MRSNLRLRNSLALLSVILFLIAWNRGIALLYAVFALVLAILIIAYVTPRFILRKVQVVRLHDTIANQDDYLDIQVTLKNPGWFARYLIEVIQPPPGNNVKNAGHSDEKAGMVLVPVLKKQYQLHIPVKCPQRGLHKLPNILLRSGYPLGINTETVETIDNESQVLVYPTPFPLSAFPYISASHMPVTTNRTISQVGYSHEHFGVREYQHGDSPRHIHWPLTARQNNLMVREYEYTTATQVTILLDMNRHSNVGSGHHSTFEYSVKIAASIAQYACSAGHRVQLLGYGNDVVEVYPGTGHKHYERILVALAHVQADGDTPYRDATRMALQQIQQGSVLIAFDSPSPTAKEHELPGLYHHHIQPVWIRFDSQSFIKPQTPGQHSPIEFIGTMPIYNIGCGDDLASVLGAIS